MDCQSHTVTLSCAYRWLRNGCAVFKTHPPRGPARLASQSSFYENTYMILTNTTGFESRNYYFRPKCQRHKHLPAPPMPVPEHADGSEGNPGFLPCSSVWGLWPASPRAPSVNLQRDSISCSVPAGLAGPHAWTWNPERPLSSVLPPCASSRAAT